MGKFTGLFSGSDYKIPLLATVDDESVEFGCIWYDSSIQQYAIDINEVLYLQPEDIINLLQQTIKTIKDLEYV